jgi:L-fucose isomerase-like protein
MNEIEILRREVLKLDADKRLLEDKVYKLKEEVETAERIANHMRKMVVWYSDITMVGEHSGEYEDGFWDAVNFVKEHQLQDTYGKN